MRLIFAVAILLAGCVTIYPPSYSSSAKPTFPRFGRVPATAETANVHIVQLYCPDGKFYFKAETSVSDYPRTPGCFAMVEDDMNSPVTIRLNYFTANPSGNFADVVLEKALNYNDRSYREMPMTENRDYLVRGGQCGNIPFFLVTSAAKGSVEVPSTVQSLCRLEPEFRVVSNLALAGVYPRVFGESIQSFVIKLTGK